ncbi:hypothetical protein C8P64_0133 [Christiangramia gaetbulicola]|uniref:Uncharacterized protein n=2 Tax=Christiangramia gaetbulicola TaxID=703340 RepID=A0A2T6AK17_9FLAO|nr:hypothetical protein C8P64_0133 [Christiangramia gaetbulicola]
MPPKPVNVLIDRFFYTLLIFGVNRPKMKKQIFKALAKLNKKVFPSYSKKGLDLQKASKVQMAIIGWKLWVTKNSLS